MVLSKLANGTRKVLNVTSPFYTIIQVSRSITSQIKTEVQQVLNALLIFGCCVVSMFLGGFYGIIIGAGAGAASFRVLSSISDIEDVAEETLNRLSPATKKSVLYYCAGFLTPFRVISNLWDEMIKTTERHLQCPKFDNLMDFHSKIMAMYYLFIGFNPYKAENYINLNNRSSTISLFPLFKKYFENPLIMS